MKKLKKEPQRTCLGCRESGGKREFIRIVRSKNGDILVDETLRLPGRGAYIHNDRKCIEQAFKNKAIQRSLKIDLEEKTIENIKAQIDKLNKV